MLLVAPLVLSQQPPATTPCVSENHRAFDFWVGEWRVTTPDGKHAGDNTLQKIQNGCVIRENWRSATSPYTGTSFNFYNQQTQSWEQLWLDNQGSSLHMTGKRVDDQMIMQTAAQENAAGDTVVNKITWTKNADGTVRQLWLIITAGKPDQTAFDGLYTPVK
jgi:hypothetical protein